jgi:peptidoglycan/xylan/chitin deacetylase (PgdA/CDA1 family)
VRPKRSLKDNLRRGLLTIAKGAGMFAVSRRLTRGGLRILCYHGIWLGEGHYSNFLFMSESKFKRRLGLLKKWRIPVIGLEEAVRGLEAGTLPAGATVITIDDGWFGTFRVMVPELLAHGFPATIYSTSFYAQKRLPVFGVAVDYLLSRAPSNSIDLGALGDGLSGRHSLITLEQRENVAEMLEELASKLDPAEALRLLERLASQLGIDFQPLVQKRVFHLMSLQEITQSAQQGIDIQLHTHRHRFPVGDPSLLRQEIEENRTVLAPLTRRPLNHFCYPSGVWSEVAFPVLRSTGIRSAVTTEQGLNFSPESILKLRRISDGEYIDDLEFEAELSGFAEIVRQIRQVFRKSAQPGGEPAAVRTVSH